MHKMPFVKMDLLSINKYYSVQQIFENLIFILRKRKEIITQSEKMKHIQQYYGCLFCT